MTLPPHSFLQGVFLKLHRENIRPYFVHDIRKHLGYTQRILQALLLGTSLTASAAEFSLNIADLAAPDLSARGITLTLPENGAAELHISRLHIQQRDLHQVHIRCARFALSTAQIRCNDGSLNQVPGLRLDLVYGFRSGDWQVSAQLHEVQGKSLAPLLPTDLPQLTQGTLNGTLHVRGGASGITTFKTDVQLAEIGFSDSSGLHAAEKLRGTIRLDAARKAESWDWQADVAWQSGEMFWQPLYLRGGHQVNASGSFDSAHFNIKQALVQVPEIGRVQLSAVWDTLQDALLECTARGTNLALGRLFADYARPFLAQGALADASLFGHADVDWQYRNGATRALRLVLHDAGIADAEQRFALLGVNSEIDWRADAQRSAHIAFAGGTLLGAPLGSGQWTVQMRGMEFSMAHASLPVLDGMLELNDFRMQRQEDAWRWQFAAALSRISMEQLSRAASWPRMHGTLAGRIPKVSYDGNEIKADGALLFNVFDGTVVASQLRLGDPFGRAPHLSGNLNMRELDLDLLTRTFSFGNMQGRIDVDVNNMELQDWRPARFEARLVSSPGNYPKKISQKAVQNISALGGAGAAAAIQRSYLRFFENFGYARIGWSCVLRNDVCLMGGVDGPGSGAYTIIKGGGIPAITVMGYNRAVSWSELLTRLKRVTQNNVQAVVK